MSLYLHTTIICDESSATISIRCKTLVNRQDVQDNIDSPQTIGRYI